MLNRLLGLAATLVGLTLVVGPAQAVIGGTPDGQKHPYVGFVRNGQFACSGTAISPRLLVTAAHCFTFPTDRVWVTFDPNRRSVPFPAGFGTGTWYAHPDFCQGASTCEPGLVGFDSHDVAVVVLDEPVDLPRYAQLPSPGLVDALPNGTKVDIVGYGVEDFVVGGGQPRPARTSGFRMLAESDLIPGNFSISDEYIRLSANNAQDKGGVCFGDSGGPDLLGGTDTILAVNSFGTNGGCNGVSYSNRVDLGYALDFIGSFG